jgi:putative spermidine/putrescine transport system substrate-binding protein
MASRPRDGSLYMRAGLTRRQAIGTAGAAALLALPAIRRAQAADRSLKVSSYGGFFEQTLSQHVYPAFEKSSGIKVESMPQAEGTQFLIQLAQANKSGAAPMDLCLCGEEDVLRGRAQSVWRPFETAKIPNMAKVPASYIGQGPAGVDGIGAMAWYMTLVANPDELKPLPDSWTAFWAAKPKNWGVNGGGQSSMFEITAACYFGGIGVLDTKEGIDKVLAKIAEIKPQVKLWWDDEGTMQTAFQNDEVVGGTYYHDVAGTMQKSGTPIRSIFPKEGALQGYSAWCQPSSSKKIAEAQAFIDFFCAPEAQELVARFVGSAPVLPRSMLNLTDEEFGAVSSESTPIRFNAPARVKFADYMEAQFTKMVTA